MIRGEFVPAAYLRLDFAEGSPIQSLARAAHAAAKRLGMGVAFQWQEVVVLVAPWQELPIIIEEVTALEAEYAASQTPKRSRAAKQRAESAEDGSPQAGTLEAAYPAWATTP